MSQCISTEFLCAFYIWLMKLIIICRIMYLSKVVKGTFYIFKGLYI